MNSFALPVAASAIASFVLAVGLVFTADRHGRFTMDFPGAIQKFHSRPTPRIGGVGIYLALIAASLLVPQPGARTILHAILIAGIPALLIGLLEDLTKIVSVRTRLLATMASGAAACWISGVSLTRLNIPWFDAALAWAPVAFIFTVVAVSGVTNAINIIDGFHGLASGTVTIALLGLTTVAALCGDAALALTAAVLAAAVAGFWLVNFPWGKLFLGDGGAYFAGFALAWICVLLPMRNPAVSPWASLLLCSYPIIEVIYSIVRRRRHRESPGSADRSHLHSLVATRLVQRKFPDLDSNLQNSAVSVLMWVCAAVPAVAAVSFYERTTPLILLAAAAALLYHLLYRYLVRI